MGPDSQSSPGPRYDRREFLRLAAGGVLAASGVWACGGNDSTGLGDDGGGDETAPWLAYVLINEYDDQAVLRGVFVDPPGDMPTVMIGGLEAAIVTWNKSEIVCDLPPSGSGAAGDVFVLVAGRKSNVRQITEWTVPMRYKFAFASLPGLQVDGPVYLRFRADVGEYRDTPQGTLRKPTRGAVATRDSEAPLTASGQVPTDSDCFVSWQGQADFVSVANGPGLDRILAAWLKVDGGTRTGALGLGLGVLPPMPFVMVVECPESTSTVDLAVTFGLLDGAETFPSPDPSRPDVGPFAAIQIDFGPDYGIPAGVRQDEVMRLEWDAAQPAFPPA
ncbi:MAG TPA: IPT/TIG domain-containing protein [Gemmatimonadales bacterium]|nr:IPT/TIG domain-containing protein [Gemmatimonadales bacterium]